ncbi:MAG TPA: sugar phosphate isomerase/epimerase [Vicinamibacterales bacterium]|nr:sugar phosphate isomerase/epimerase [Vicinamibacterales bacterium]
MTTAPRVLASTTSHKREPLMPTLEVFGRLGLRDVDLNLHHLLEKGEAVADVVAAAARNSLRLRVVSGGWCDFYDRAPKVQETFASVARQVAIANALSVDYLRLFFGRLSRADYVPAARQTIVANLLRLSDAHPHITFVFENHDGASLDPEVTIEVLGLVARPNIRMNFDPINFAKAGVDPMAALTGVRQFVSHVHLKGLERGEYCEFGEGDVDLTPVLQALVESGYGGRFTVEYEGANDGTLRLYRSVERARVALGDSSTMR